MAAAIKAATCTVVGLPSSWTLSCYDGPGWSLLLSSTPSGRGVTFARIRPLGSAAIVTLAPITRVWVRPLTSAVTAVWITIRRLVLFADRTPPSWCYRNNHKPALTLTGLFIELLKSVASCWLGAHTLTCVWIQDLVVSTSFLCCSRTLTCTFIRIEVLLSLAGALEVMFTHTCAHGFIKDLIPGALVG